LAANGHKKISPLGCVQLITVKILTLTVFIKDNRLGAMQKAISKPFTFQNHGQRLPCLLVAPKRWRRRKCSAAVCRHAFNNRRKLASAPESARKFPRKFLLPFRRVS
jgi:hypothetical protein